MTNNPRLLAGSDQQVVVFSHHTPIYDDLQPSFPGLRGRFLVYHPFLNLCRPGLCVDYRVHRRSHVIPSVRYPEGLRSAGILSAVGHALSRRAYSTWRLTGYALLPSTFGEFDDPTARAGWVVRQANKGARSRCGQDTRAFVVGQVIHDHSLPIALRKRR